MTRKSLRPQLNQIRGWVKQGRTDAWIAHQLDVTVQQIESFKRQHSLHVNGDESTSLEEVDLRAEDDAAIAEELEQAEREAEERRAEEARKEEEAKAEAERKAKEQEEEDGKKADTEKKPRRSRTTRSRRRGASKTFEGTFDHGEEGYGLWLDPAVEDSPIYAEHWAGHRPVEVTIEEDQIVIRRASSVAADEE